MQSDGDGRGHIQGACFSEQFNLYASVEQGQRFRADAVFFTAHDQGDLFKITEIKMPDIGASCRHFEADEREAIRFQLAEEARRVGFGFKIHFPDGSSGRLRDFRIRRGDGVAGEVEFFDAEGFGQAEDHADVIGHLHRFEDEAEGEGLAGGRVFGVGELAEFHGQVSRLCLSKLFFKFFQS